MDKDSILSRILKRTKVCSIYAFLLLCMREQGTELNTIRVRDNTGVCRTVLKALS